MRWIVLVKPVIKGIILIDDIDAEIFKLLSLDLIEIVHIQGKWWCKFKFLQWKRKDILS